MPYTPFEQVKFMLQALRGVLQKHEKRMDDIERRVPPAQIAPDWKQNDKNALDYVKNRTHYEETVSFDIAGLEFNCGGFSGEEYEHGQDIPFALGQVWDVSYGTSSIAGLEVREAEDGTLYIGTYPDANDVPFYVTSNSCKGNSAWVSMMRPSGCIVTGVSGKATNTKIAKLDAKYLPDGVSAGAIDEAVKRSSAYYEQGHRIVTAKKLNGTTYNAEIDGFELKTGALLTIIPNETLTGNNIRLAINGGTTRNIKLQSMHNVATQVSEYNIGGTGGLNVTYIQAGKPTLLQYDGAAWLVRNAYMLDNYDLLYGDVWMQSRTCDTAADEQTKKVTYLYMPQGRMVMITFTYGNTAEYPKLQVGNSACDVVDNTGAPLKTLEIPAGGLCVFLCIDNAFVKLF